MKSTLTISVRLGDEGFIYASPQLARCPYGILMLEGIKSGGSVAVNREIPYRRDAAPTAGCQCALPIVFPKLISGLRRPIAIQAAISLNMDLPE
jgi:hypothetical protein